MSLSNWRSLLRKYAGGRQTCRCGMAYYDSDGYCGSFGCSPNQRDAQLEISDLVCIDLGITNEKEQDNG